jgi:hypothetical protein
MKWLNLFINDEKKCYIRTFKKCKRVGAIRRCRHGISMINADMHQCCRIIDIAREHSNIIHLMKLSLFKPFNPAGRSCTVSRSVTVKTVLIVISLAAAISVASSLLREVNNYLSPPPNPYNVSLYEKRFSELSGSISEKGVFCYMTDLDDWAKTQYILAPRILRLDIDCGTIIAGFGDPYAARRLAGEKHLTIIKDFGNGVMLLSGRGVE